MSTVFDPETLAALARRLETIDDARRPRWGRMSAPQMVRHLTWAVQMATGERPIAPRRTVLGLPGLKYLILNVLPFPRSAPTHPKLVVDACGTLAEERRMLLAALSVFVSRSPAAEWLPHPAFGPLTGEAWGRLVHKHIDHHLRQFAA